MSPIKLELYANKSQYSLGEQVKGKIKITSEEEFVANHVSVFLTCNESLKKTNVWGNQYGTYQHNYWDNATVYQSSYKIFGPATIPQGFSGSYP